MKRIWLLFVTAVAWAQEPSPAVSMRETKLQFDATSVKAVQADIFFPSGITSNPGRLKAQSMSVGALISYAYEVHSTQIVDLKSGLGLYDVEGKADGAYSQAELRVMLQGLLAERFHLKFHRETREIAVDRLVIANELKASQLHATLFTEADPRGYKLYASKRGPNFLTAKATAMSLERLADAFSRTTLVVDGTGLKGLYEFEVDFEIDRTEITDKNVAESDAASHVREALLSAMGLKLQGAKKAPVEVLVIDRVERPDPN